MSMFGRHTHMFTCVYSVKQNNFAGKCPKKVPHRFKLHLGALAQKRVMPTGEIESAIVSRGNHIFKGAEVREKLE